MGNRTYLIESEKREPIPRVGEPTTALAAGKNCIPVYWYSLFDETCICDNVVTLSDGQIEQYPYLITSTGDARKRLSLRHNWFARFSAPSSNFLTDQWLAFVEGIRGPFLHIDTAELWMLMGSPNCQNHLLNCLRDFEQSDNIAWEEILDVSQIDFDGLARPIAAFKLAGFSWGGPPLLWE